MRLEQRELSAFLGVARLGSVSAAANALGITQPALSRTVSRLEQRLGVELFLRHASGMELTTFGQALLPHASLIEAGMRNAVDEMDLLRGASKGVARIGILPSIAIDLLPRILASSLPKLLGIQIHVLEATANRLIGAIAHGEIDFAISGLLNEPAQENLHFTVVGEDKICVVARKEHPLLSAPKLSEIDLAAYPWAMPEKESAMYSNFRRLFLRSNSIPPPVVILANSVQTLKAIVGSGDFLTMLPRRSIRGDREKSTLRALPLQSTQWVRQLAIVRRASGPLLPAAELLLVEIKKAIAALEF